MPRYELSWITGSLALGHAPMSYAELDSIREQGIGAIMNLCAEFCDLHSIEENHGFEVYYLPIDDNEAPSEQDLDRALDWLDEAVYLGKKVLVHCRCGMGRTAMVVAAYLLRKGFGLKPATRKVEQARTMHSSFPQWRLLRKYSKKSGRLTIREPSLESRRVVDLSPFFDDHESLLDWLDELLHQSGETDEGEPVCDCKTDRCCYEYVELSFIEAAYLSHHMNKSLSGYERQNAIERAVAVAARIKEMERALKSGAMQASARGHGLTDAYRAAKILCPLNVDGRCEMFPFRPIACRIYGLTEGRRGGPLEPPADAGREELEVQALTGRIRSTLATISANMLYALSSFFPAADSLAFSLIDAVSGRFIQKYFESVLRSNGGELEANLLPPTPTNPSTG